MIASQTEAQELKEGRRYPKSPVVVAPRIQNLWWTPTTANGLKTHCNHGHPYDETNTYYRKKGRGAQGQDLFQRYCKICLAAKWMRYYMSHRYKFRLYRKAARRRLREAQKLERIAFREQKRVARERGELWAFLP